MLAAAGRPASGKSPGTSVESCKRYFIAPRTNRSTWKITSPKAIECELQLRKDVYLSITCHQQPQALMQTTSRHKKYTKTMQVPMEEAGSLKSKSSQWKKEETLSNAALRTEHSDLPTRTSEEAFAHPKLLPIPSSRTIPAS